jgi:tRNA(adenine34) deaminase
VACPVAGGAITLERAGRTTRTLPGVDRVKIDELMGIALDEARAAAEHGDVPIGAVVALVESGEVVARRHNQREQDGDPTAHAEILALRDAARAAGSWRLDGHALVVTLEPCPMCAGAVVAARLGLVAFGAADPKAGALGSLYNLAADPRLNHEATVVDGVRAAECAALLTEFFATRRN